MPLHRVPVEGGTLTVEVTAGETEPVLAIHGISSHRHLWDWLRADSPDITLVTPDLRGRAESLDVRGPYSMWRHAEDMVAVLDALELPAVHVVGMSMGGFVAIELAVSHADRVKSLVLVDGGFPMAQPPGLSEENLPTVFADRIARLAHSWTKDDFVEFFTTSTAPLLDPTDPILLSYLDHDLAADGTVRLSGEALLQDAASIFFSPSRWREITQPVRFLHAEWSSGADTSPAYPDISEYAGACVEVVKLDGLDHAGSIMTKQGAAATAELLRKALA